MLFLHVQAGHEGFRDVCPSGLIYQREKIIEVMINTLQVSGPCLEYREEEKIMLGCESNPE